MAISRATLLLVLFVLHGGFFLSGAAPLNVMEILGREGGHSTFIRYLTATDAGRQMNSYVNRGSKLTVFAPTDNAFGKLESGFFDRYSPREKMEFLLTQFVPQFYTWENFPSAKNVMSMGGGNYTLDFLASGGQQVSISTGLVTVQVGKQINVTFPLAVYSIDTVLQHSQLFPGASGSSEAPVPPSTPPPSSALPSTPPSSPSEPSSTPPSVPPASSTPPSSALPSTPTSDPSSALPSMPPSSQSSAPPSLTPSSASSAPPSLPPSSPSEPSVPPATPSGSSTIPTVPESEPPTSAESASFQIKATWWSSLVVLFVASLV